jgi:hypothetical protein
VEIFASHDDEQLTIPTDIDHLGSESVLSPGESFKCSLVTLGDLEHLDITIPDSIILLALDVGSLMKRDT